MTEQQPYIVVRDYGAFEVRRYPQHLLAEVTVDGGFESAGPRAFRTLFAYITGSNDGHHKISMTAPVLQSVADDATTAVDVVASTSLTDERHRVAFVLPESLAAGSAPAPTDPAVRLRTAPESVVAAARFSGRWTEARYRGHRNQLLADVYAAGLTPTGAEKSARFDPPFMPPFLRHNEVLLDIEPSP